MMHKHIIAVLACVFLATIIVSAAQSPPPASLKFMIQSSGIEQIQKIVNPLLLGFLQNTTIPDQSISKLGITLNLTDIQISGFDLGTETVVLQEPDTLTISTTSLSCAIKMNWRYTDGPAIDWSGWAEDDVAGTTVKATLVVGSDAHGRASLSAQSAGVSIGSLQIHLHGSGGQLFQAIATLMEPVIRKVAEKAISDNMVSGLNAVLGQLFQSVPVVAPLLPGTEIYYGLVPTPAQRGMNGTLYHNCVFGGRTDPALVTDLASVSLSAYNSIDVAGYFRPEVSGSYVWKIAYTQRGQLDIGSLVSIGSLEPHNIGMCWPEHHTTQSPAVAMDAAQYYPIRLRYQAGCGGGSVSVSVCDATGANCQPVSPLDIATLPVTEFPITVLPGGIETCSAAEAYATAHPQDAPYTHVQLPAAPALGSAMLGVVMDQFVINSIGYAAAQAGDLNVVVTDAEIPATSPFRLNTTSLQNLIPALYAAYPNDLVELLLQSGGDTGCLPVVDITTAGLTASISSLLNASVVINATGERVPVFTLQVTLLANGTVGTSGSSITGQIAALQVQLNVVWSAVTVNAVALQGLLNFFATRLVIPQLNAKLAAGFPLPVVQGVSLVNSHVTYGEGYIVVATDFSYQGK